MARFEKPSASGAKPDAGLTSARKSSSAPARGVLHREQKPKSIEDTMFFPRMRRHMKWVWWMLILFFAVGFVAFGVGAGGVGFGDIFKGNDNGGTSISSARKKTEKDPKNVQAWRDLGLAYQTAQKPTEAVTAFEQASALAPKDTSILRELGGAQRDLASQKQTDAGLAQLQGAYAAPTDPALGFQVKGQNVIGTDKITSAVASRYTTRLNEAYAAASAAASASVSTYKKIVALEPDDPSVQLELAQIAESAGDQTAAVAAYKAFLKLAPDDSNATLVKERLKALEPKPATPKAKASK